jgi:hypothetical protein
MERFETLKGEKHARADRLLLSVLLAAVLVAYGAIAFGIYELIQAIA